MQEFPGFTVEFRDGIYIYTITAITRSAVDAWYEADKAQALAAAATTGHALRLLRLTQLILPTPYFRSKLRQSNLETPANLYESSAFVIQNAMAFHTLRPFLQTDLSSYERNMRGLFQNEALAIRWLHQRRDQVALLQAKGKDPSPE